VLDVPRSARLAAWGSAFLAGRAPLERVLRAVVRDDEPHRGKVPATRILVIDFATSFYFHRDGGRLLFGMGDPAEQPGFDTTVRWDFLPEVVETGVARLPALADAVVSHAWAGLYEMTPDAMPSSAAAMKSAMIPARRATFRT